MNPQQSDRTWFYCASCRIAVHRREVGHEVQSNAPYHFKCGGDVEVRKS